MEKQKKYLKCCEREIQFIYGCDQFSNFIFKSKNDERVRLPGWSLIHGDHLSSKQLKLGPTNLREQMSHRNQGKIPKEIESLSLAGQRNFFHSLREEAEVGYVQIYSDYRSQWKHLNSQFAETFRDWETVQKEYVGRPVTPVDDAPHLL